MGWAGIFGPRHVNRRLFGEGDIELVLTGTGLCHGLPLGLITAATYANTEHTVNTEASLCSLRHRRGVAAATAG